MRACRLLVTERSSRDGWAPVDRMVTIAFDLSRPSGHWVSSQRAGCTDGAVSAPLTATHSEQNSTNSPGTFVHGDRRRTG
jgi:hypothetical protein